MIETSLLDGKSILVTGAARRVGAEIARFLHAAGASVALHYRHSHAEAETLAAEFNQKRPDSATVMHADLLDIASLPAVVQKTVATFGRLDGLINNASSFFPTPLGKINETAWDDLIGSNLKAPLFLSQAAAPHLKAANGTIINIVDIHADYALPGFPVYCAAKAGLAGLTRALAVELAPEVRVNGVAPGAILWPENGAFSAAEQDEVIQQALLKRCGEPADIARAVRFLFTDAPYITGHILPVDGGRTAYR